MTDYVVSGAAAIVKDDQGKIRYLYQGAVVPTGVPSAELDRLEELGLIEPVDLPEVHDAELDDEPAVVEDADGVQHVGILPLSSAVERPKRTSPKADWLAYRGVPEDQADELTGAQLQDDQYMTDWATRQQTAGS